MAKQQTRLGRGLGSLISKGAGVHSVKKASKKSSQKASTKTITKKAKPGAQPEAQRTENPLGFQEVPVNAVEVSPYQPRGDIDPAHIKELVESIRSEGLLQPIVVRKIGDRFQLVAGERRWRACRALKLKTILARVIDTSDASSAVISLIENLQRENLNPIDEAMGYASLMRDFDLTQEAVAERVGKPRATIANALRILNLEQEIQGYIGKGIMSVGHAKVILGLDNAAQRLLLARRIIEAGMSVREAEKALQQFKRQQVVSNMPRPVTNVQTAVVQDLQRQMTSHLNTKVQIKHTAKKGQIVIEYRGNDDLHRILQKIGFISSERASVA